MIDLNSYKTVLDNISDGVYVLDGRRIITYWNKAAEILTGFSAAEVIGKSCYDNILTHVDCAGVCLCKDFCPVAKTLLDGQTRQAHIFLHHKNGHRVPVKVSAAAIRDAAGNIVSAVEVFRDDSQAIGDKAAIEALKKHSLYDLVTGLPNRRYTETRIQSRMDETRRFGWPMGIFIAEVDHHVELHREHSPDTAMRVLKMVGHSLANAVRTLDTVGKWDENSFMAVIGNTEIEQLQTITERARMLVETSYLTTGRSQLRVTVSIGATCAEQTDTVESLIRRAETCVYHSRSSGRNRVTIHVEGAA